MDNQDCRNQSARKEKHFRSIWISDMHLGMPQCRAESLLEFLESHKSEYLYLVGDVIDWERLSRSFRWSDKYSRVVRKILALAETGTKVFYIPGNHDHFVRPYIGSQVCGITVVDQAVHETAQGQKLLVLHGDEFCGKKNQTRLNLLVAEILYYTVLSLNCWLNIVRKMMGLDYWSLGAWVKQNMAAARDYLFEYAKAVVAEGRRFQADGVVCGHVHYPEIKLIDGMLYCNNGDWIDSCSAIAEDRLGNMHLIEWEAKSRLPQFGYAFESGKRMPLETVPAGG